MENDIKTSQALREHFEKAFWTREHLRNNTPLEFGHLWPAFVMLGAGLGLSTVAFFLELLHRLYRKRIDHNGSAPDLIRDNKLEEVTN